MPLKHNVHMHCNHKGNHGGLKHLKLFSIEEIWEDNWTDSRRHWILMIVHIKRRKALAPDDIIQEKMGEAPIVMKALF